MTNYFGKLGTNEAKILEQFNPTIMKYIKAQNSADVDLFISLFDDKHQPLLNPAAFHESQTKLKTDLGRIIQTSFLCSIRKKGDPWLLYKVDFDKSEDDHILTVIINDDDRDWRIKGVWIS
ncbi:hypothetical protein RYZ26_10420 [Terasakiella sp. A23]|uniref:hypothetical protein n=1 Tax=Terasakiella sp. FCG-A23 TaxID=3080561 RepID=UPI00295450C0|nr:hypothetical protein [Terasakiella sp. A23]MDV7340009.1 hypothetical protein [Terasakiella sp. A23]